MTGKRYTVMSGSNRIALWLLGILLLCGLAWLGYWFATNFEQRTKEIRSDISPEARKNHYLAAQMFLQRLGENVESQTGRKIFSHKPSPEDTIFLGSHSLFYLKHNGQALHDWVNAGGNLILVADDPDFDDAKAQPLLKELGVEFGSRTEDASDKPCKGTEKNCSADDKAPTEKSNKRPSFSSKEKDNLITVTFHADHPGEFKARFLRDHYLKDTKGTAEVAVGTKGHANLLQYALGEGYVSILSDARLFQNEAIDKLDHAYLLYLLAGNSKKVWIYYSANMPSLLALLWKHAPYVTLAAVALLFLFGWKMRLKSGPRLAPRDAQRRNLLEHLDAAAEYSWRVDNARQLLADNRSAVEQAWSRRHPQMNSFDQQQRCEWLSEKSGIAARAIERTLYGEITSEQDFIRATAVLQKLAVQANLRSAAPIQ